MKTTEVACPECQYGYTSYVEDGRMVSDACYACWATGLMSVEQFKQRYEHNPEFIESWIKAT